MTEFLCWMMTKLSKPSGSSRKPTTLEDTIHLVKPILRQICSHSGTPGLAIGIFDRSGKVLDTYHGYRDISKGLPPDANTVFNIGSMSKGFTALAMACLVVDGKIHWDDRIDTYLCDLRSNRNGEYTVRDLLSHRTGLSRSDALFVGSDNQLLLTKDQGTVVFESLNASRPLRQDFIYNNFGYHAAGCVIETVSSMSYGDFLRQRIFKPLGMNRTFTELPSILDENIAQAYIPYYNLQLRQVPPPRIANDTVAFSAGAIRSCLHDLMIFYAALLRKFRPINIGTMPNDLSFLVNELSAIFEATIPLHNTSSLREQSYGMGWARTQLPNHMSELSGNSGLLDAYPTLGDTSNAPLILHHGGNNIGCSSSVYILPESECGFIVLGNALGHCDATDWTAQALTEAYLFAHITTPFIKYVNASAKQGRSTMEHVQARLDKEKLPGNPPSSLKDYTGTFLHKSRQFCIVVTVEKNRDRDELSMSLQGRDEEMYRLHYYHEQTFVFNESFDQVVNRGKWCRPYWFYKIQFLWNNMNVDALRWQIDDTETQGQVFEKVH